MSKNAGQKIVDSRLSVLELAGALGNVTEACRRSRAARWT